MRKNKNPRKKLTISSKITLMYGGILAIAVFVISLIVFVNVYFVYRDNAKLELAETVKTVEEYLKSGAVVSEEAIKDLAVSKYIDIKVTDLSDFKQFLTGGPDELFRRMEDNPQARPFHIEELNEPPSNELRDGKNNIWNGLLQTSRYMYYGKDVFLEGKGYSIQASRQYSREMQVLHLFMMIFILLNIVGLFIAFFVGKYISKKMLKPIVDITELAGRISIEDLNKRITVEGPDDEIAKLAFTFNDMIHRLAISFEKQSRFISDASHELRTPISVIQGYANLMSRWGKNDPVILQECIDSIKSETEHMSMLVKKLLFLARDDGKTQVAQKKQILLNSIVQEVVKEASVLEITQKIIFNDEENVEIMGDFHLLKQMMWIFVENSIKYGKSSDGYIQIYVFIEDGHPSLTIKDNGIGMEEEDVEHIFERFYRSDKSRNKEIPGTGLGLSIAGWILKQHDAKYSVKSKLGEGMEISIVFPPLPAQNNIEKGK